MEADAFLEVFGNLMVTDVVRILLALGFMVYIGKKVNAYLIKRHDIEEKKNAQLKKVLDAVEKYPEYRRQSVEIQEKLEEQIQGLRKFQQESIQRLDKMEVDTKRRERNKCRDTLLQNFRYFTSKEKNPMQAWTRMEAEAFWELFHDYQDMEGNGYVHTEVQPRMNLLEIIELNDVERVTELMKSRG